MSREFEEYEMRAYMGRCIQLAVKASFDVGKPLVGALVLSKDGRVVGEGYKDFIDSSRLIVHAERMAISLAGDYTKGGSLFTTLEPCIKVSKSQILRPCSELIVSSNIDTVVIALEDRSYKVNKKRGINYLIEHGVNVKMYKGLNHLIIEHLMHPFYRKSLLIESSI